MPSSDVPSMEDLVGIVMSAGVPLQAYINEPLARAILAAVLPLVLVPAGEALERAMGQMMDDDNPDCECEGCSALRRARAIRDQIRALAETAKGGG
jgi:hypothetical protein